MFDHFQHPATVIAIAKNTKPTSSRLRFDSTRVVAVWGRGHAVGGTGLRGAVVVWPAWPAESEAREADGRAPVGIEGGLAASDHAPCACFPHHPFINPTQSRSMALEQGYVVSAIGWSGLCDVSEGDGVDVLLIVRPRLFELKSNPSGYFVHIHHSWQPSCRRPWTPTRTRRPRRSSASSRCVRVWLPCSARFCWAPLVLAWTGCVILRRRTRPDQPTTHQRPITFLPIKHIGAADGLRVPPAHQPAHAQRGQGARARTYVWLWLWLAPRSVSRRLCTALGSSTAPPPTSNLPTRRASTGAGGVPGSAAAGQGLLPAADGAAEALLPGRGVRWLVSWFGGMRRWGALWPPRDRTMSRARDSPQHRTSHDLQAAAARVGDAGPDPRAEPAVPAGGEPPRRVPLRGAVGWCKGRGAGLFIPWSIFDQVWDVGGLTLCVYVCIHASHLTTAGAPERGGARQPLHLLPPPARAAPHGRELPQGGWLCPFMPWSSSSIVWRYDS